MVTQRSLIGPGGPPPLEHLFEFAQDGFWANSSWRGQNPKFKRVLEFLGDIKMGILGARLAEDRNLSGLPSK